MDHDQSTERPAGRGLFIVLEGIDGAGTTTQLARLTEWLRARGEAVHGTREPSDGPVGALVRQILRKRVVSRAPGAAETHPVDGRAVALLYAADRLDHLTTEVDPLRARGVHVVSDRYVLSSLAYQSGEAPLEWVRAINGFAVAPDLTVLLRVRPEVALARIAESRSGRERFEELAFQQHVARAYDTLAAELPAEQVCVLDGEAPPAEVSAALFARVGRLLGD